jgi:hypothetical protein
MRVWRGGEGRRGGRRVRDEWGETVERESFSALVTGNCKRLVIKTVALT